MQRWVAELYEHESPTALHKFLRFITATLLCVFIAYPPYLAA